MHALSKTVLGVIRLTTNNWLSLLLLFAAAAGGDAFPDAATRIAYDIEAGAGRLGQEASTR
jgi:hypothetical protein